MGRTCFSLLGLYLHQGWSLKRFCVSYLKFWYGCRKQMFINYFGSYSWTLQNVLGFAWHYQKLPSSLGIYEYSWEISKKSHRDAKWNLQASKQPVKLRGQLFTSSTSLVFQTGFLRPNVFWRRKPLTTKFVTLPAVSSRNRCACPNIKPRKVVHLVRVFPC